MFFKKEISDDDLKALYISLVIYRALVNMVLCMNVIPEQKDCFILEEVFQVIGRISLLVCGSMLFGDRYFLFYLRICFLK